jgi:hypothetical protein
MRKMLVVGTFGAALILGGVSIVWLNPGSPREVGGRCRLPDNRYQSDLSLPRKARQSTQGTQGRDCLAVVLPNVAQQNEKVGGGQGVSPSVLELSQQLGLSREEVGRIALPGTDGKRAREFIGKKLREWSGALPDKAVQEAFGFLDLRYSADYGMSLLEFNALKNDLLLKLIRQNKLPADLCNRMIGMYRDRTHDDLWRDYCVQHFLIYYERKWPSGPAPKEDREAAAIQSAYWDAADETGNTIAGTALLGLERLSRTETSVDRRRVADKVRQYAENDNCPLQTRITSMQLCGVMGLEGILATARRVAENAGNRIPLRMSAIATIGDVGGQSEAEFLTRIAAQASNMYVQNAAKSALKRLESRLGKSQ